MNSVLLMTHVRFLLTAPLALLFLHLLVQDMALSTVFAGKPTANNLGLMLKIGLFVGVAILTSVVRGSCGDGQGKLCPATSSEWGGVRGRKGKERGEEGESRERWSNGLRGASRRGSRKGSTACTPRPIGRGLCSHGSCHHPLSPVYVAIVFEHVD